MAGRPGKNYSFGGGGRRGGRLLGALVSGAPQLEEDPKNVGVEGPTQSGAPLDPLDEGEAKLRARGIKTPIYKKPGFFTNLLTAGAAGEQAWDANTRAMSEKNRMLSEIATQEESQKHADRLEQVRHGNAITAARQNAIANMLSASGVVPTEENIARWDAANSGLGIEAGGAGLQQNKSKALLGVTENDLRRGTIEQNPDVFRQEHIDKAQTAGIANETAWDANLRENQLHPYRVSEAQFLETQQPERRVQLIGSNAAQQIANEKTLAQKPFWGMMFGPGGDYTQYGDPAGGTPVTEVTRPQTVYDEQVTPGLPGMPPIVKQVKRTSPGKRERSITPGFSPEDLKRKKLLGERP